MTGAGGFSGRHTCDTFRRAGWEVAAVVSPSRAALAAPNETSSSRTTVAAQDETSLSQTSVAATDDTISRVVCDLTDTASVLELVGRVLPDAVVHLAGRNAVDRSWSDPVSTLEANLIATANVLEAVRQKRPDGRVLVVGSMIRPNLEQLAEAAHPYGFSKGLQVLAALSWHRWYGISVVIAEPANLIGPGESAGLCGKIARWIAATERSEREDARATPFHLSSLEEKRDFLDVRDAASAYELLVRKGQPGFSYAVESGTMVSLREVKETFERLAEASLCWTIGQSRLRSPLSRDVSPLRKLGWKAAIPFRSSILETLEYERKRPRDQA